MKFLPTSDLERQAMLAAIGVTSVDELFAAVPAAVRGAPDLPAPLSEIEIRRFLGGLAALNANARETAFFLGGASTTTTFRRSRTRCSTGPSGSPPTRRISPRPPRARSSRSSSSRRTSAC